MKQWVRCESCAVFLREHTAPERITLESSLTDLVGYNYQHGISFSVSSKPRAGLTAFLADQTQATRLHGEMLRSHPSRAGHTPKHLKDKMCKSLLAIPLLFEERRLLGFVKCENKIGQASFTSEDQQNAQLLADRLVQALELHDEYDTFCHSILGGGERRDLAATLTDFLATSKGMIPIDAGIVYLTDRTTRTLRCFATVGCGRAFSPKEFKFRWRDKSIATHVLQTRQTFYHPNILQCPLAHRWGIKRFSIKGSIVGSPIVVGRSVLGVMVGWSRSSPKSLKRTHAESLLAVCELAGPFLQQHYRRRDALAKLHDYIHNLDIGLFRKDANLRITYCNHFYRQLLSKPISDILGRTDLQLFPRELAQKFRRDDRTVLKTGKTLSTIEPNVDQKTGHTILVDVVKKPLSKEGGKSAGIQGVFLRIKPEYFDRFAEAERIADIGSWEWDIRSNAFSASSNYWRLLHRTEPKIPCVHADFLSLLPEDAAKWIQGLRAASKSCALRTPRQVSVHVGGAQRLMVIQAQKLTAVESSLLKIYGTLQDVTAARLAEFHRTQTSALETFREIAGQVSHDTLGHFQAIKTNLQVLEMQNRNPKSAVVIERALRAFHNAFNTLQQLTGDTENQVEPFRLYSVGQLLEDVTVAKSTDLEANRITLTIDIAEKLPGVSAVGTQVKTVISNIVQNAIEAMPDGGKLIITASLASKEPEKSFTGDTLEVLFDGWVQIDFRDSGPGVPADIQEKVFETNFTTKGRVGGGFGLASNRRIMRLHKGWIELLKTNNSEGATFRLLFPAFRRMN